MYIPVSMLNLILYFFVFFSGGQPVFSERPYHEIVAECMIRTGLSPRSFIQLDLWSKSDDEEEEDENEVEDVEQDKNEKEKVQEKDEGKNDEEQNYDEEMNKEKQQKNPNHGLRRKIEFENDSAVITPKKL